MTGLFLLVIVCIIEVGVQSVERAVTVTGIDT